MDDGKVIQVTIHGDKMLQHNGQLADPLNEYSKAMKVVHSKTKKSDDDHYEIARIEFQGGLYFDKDNGLGPYIPGEVLESVLLDGGKKKKRGRDFSSGVRVVEEQVKLEYKGPRDRDGLWEDPRFRDRRAVTIKGNRIMRTRPLFKDWSLTFNIQILPGASVNVEHVNEALEDAGLYVGIGDFRPGAPKRGGKFGMFKVVESKELKQPKAKKAA